MKENVDYTDYERGFLDDRVPDLSEMLDDEATEEHDHAEVIR